jgi:hypothetical protein
MKTTFVKDLPENLKLLALRNQSLAGKYLERYFFN